MDILRLNALMASQATPAHANGIAAAYLSLLSQLTTAPEMGTEALNNALAGVFRHSVVLVAVDKETGAMCGAGSLLLEQKAIHCAGMVGHIEDVVTHSAFRKRGIGSKLVEELTQLAREAGCYKVILDCAPDNARFYEQSGFACKGLQMAQYFS
jgi:glucosamine-phosphate N-acetyltransferase